jgi:hypothetical protein
MSRLARASKDWHPWRETCARCGTVRADWDGIEDPSPSHDRLFWGLHGTRSAAERHRLTPRMEQGQRKKARRGERHCGLPSGYGRDAAGGMAFAPDAPVPHVVPLMWRQGEELGTRHALGRSLAHQGLARGVRRRAGPAQGTLAWRGPKRTTVHALLSNPLYAGAYAEGRRQVDGRRKRPGRPRSGRGERAPHASPVWRKDAVPASSTWAQ